VQRNGAKLLTLGKPQHAKLCFANPRRIRQYRLENRLQLALRHRDYLQDVRGRRLLLQRLAEIVRALAKLVKQPRVLDRDRRLVCEGLEQRDLLIRNRINFGTSKLNRSDRHPLAQKRNTKRRPVPQPFRKGAAFRKLIGFSLEVNYVDRLPLENGAASDTPTRARKLNADFLRNRTPVGGRTNVLPVEIENGHVVGSTEARGPLDDNVKHGLELGRRGADDPQNLGCRRLLLEHFGELLFQLGFGFINATHASPRLRPS